MKNKNVRGILALAVVTALSFGVIGGAQALSGVVVGDAQVTTEETKTVEVLEELDTTGFEGIEKAVRTTEGYLVTVRTKGYGGDMILDVAFDAEGKKVTGVTVVGHKETEGVGSKITEEEFLSQFNGVEAPVYLPGMTEPMTLEETAEETPVEEAVEEPAEEAEKVSLEGAVFTDGEYVAESERDENGFVDQVTMTVEGGKITAVNWEAIAEDGSKKSVMSENGEYTMTEDGLTWKAQSEALAAALVENQSLDAITMNEEGKTDAVSGVSIYVGGFVGLAEQCMVQAAEAATAAPAVLNDGEYVAESERDENGFVDQVTMTIADGKITAVNWEAIAEDGSKKSVMSENGEYTMTEDGLTWKAQAEALAAALVEGQSLDAIEMNEEGKTDAVSGVSIYVGGFVGLAEQCLNQAAGVAEAAPVVLNDGEYVAESERDENGFVDQVTMTIADGKITAVNWEAIAEDGSKKSVMSENGEYTMTEDGLTWKAQAEALAAALVEGQSLDAIGMNEDGKTDAVSGVSIYVGGFVGLAEQCLNQAAGVEMKDEIALTDGEYISKSEKDDNGFTDQVTMTVEGGKITAVEWESIAEDGSKKSVMSENGEYTMTEDGLTWKAQAEALAANMVENQNLDAITMNEEGKTDAVSGVSIYVGGFVGLAQDCLNQAAGVEAPVEEETEAPTEEATEAPTEAAAPENGTVVDAVSGATISSTAAVTAINMAFDFLNA